MAKTTDAAKIVIADDEIHNMVWMIDYLESRGIEVLTASNVESAIDTLSREIYRAAIIDLSIPPTPRTEAAIAKEGLLYSKYPGLYIAMSARNLGYRDRQVMIYSVHKDDAVAKEALRLRCTYILKGRPMEIKTELDSVLSFDPTV